MKTKSRRLLCLLLCGVMILALSSCGSKSEAPEKADDGKSSYAFAALDTEAKDNFTEAPGSLKKTETVFINLDSSGKTSGVTVSDWLHTDRGQVRVEDKSALKNIVNVKSDVQPLVNKDGLTWMMPETDLYYSGETADKPPVSFEITYTLDGKKISLDALAGQSGEVEIKVKMKNEASKTVVIGGKKTKVYLPLLVVGGMVLPEPDFSGVKVENGTAIGDGSKEIVVLFGMPGMSESLGLDGVTPEELGGLSFSDTASVKAAVKDFELENMYFAALPLASLDLGVELPDSTDELTGVINAVKQIESSLSGMDIDRLMKAFTDDPEAVSGLLDSVNSAISLYDSNKALFALLEKYTAGENGEELKKALSILQKPETAAALERLSDSSVLNLFTDLAELKDTLPLITELSEDMQNPEIKKAVESLPETLEAIADLKAEIDKNSELISALGELTDSDSLGSIQKAAEALGSLNIEALTQKYSALTDNADVIVRRSAEWLKYGREYGLFTAAPEGAETSLMFVYMTPSIRPVVTADTPYAAPTGESILDSLLAKFRK